MDFLAGQGRWLRGNLHTHTTLSDGALTPQECIRLYKQKGYDFLCITDHHKCFAGGEYGGLLVLGGVELNNNSFEPRVCWHLTGAGLLQPVEDIPTSADPQAMVDALRSAGAYVTLAHPAWSLMTHEHMMALTGYEAVEIYNGVSDFYSGRADSSVQMDTLAAHGRFAAVTAADDTHFYQLDVASGWVMVLAQSCTREGILEALRSGRSYATQGPALHSLRLEDGCIRVETSPLRQIIFYSDSFYSAQRVHNAPAGGSITSAAYTPEPHDTWVRVEGVDAAGKRVWSNYIGLQKSREG